jgi:DNA polymerase-1
VSSDKDLMQLVIDGSVELLDTMKNKRIASAEVMERFGVPPSKVVEVQALAGDSTDNVPGVRGIGVKTAAELINTYGDLETLLKRAGEIKQPKRRETLIENAENARISLRLVTLDDKVKLKEGIESFLAREPEPATSDRLPQGDGIRELAKRRAAAHFGVEDLDAVPPAADPKEFAHVPSGNSKPPAQTAGTCKPCRQRRARRRDGSRPILKPIDHDAYEP